MTVRVMEGHVLDVLRSIPSNTFQCAATSPPYYGLRDYGLPPQVWGGEPAHEHEWEPLPLRTPWVARPDHNNGVFTGTRGVHASSAEVSKERAAGAFCACGAWLGSLGLEPTPELYVEHLVSVFREVRRVLRPDGVCWVNLGDSYAGSGKGPSNGLQPLASQPGAEHEMSDEEHDRLLREAMDADMERADQKRRQGFDKSDSNRGSLKYSPLGGVVPSGCKPKDLLGMPWMVAFALRADGWYLRAEIIWSKPNPMPESVTDRPTKAHETVFLLAKSRTYFYDADAIREPIADGTEERYAAPFVDRYEKAASGGYRGAFGGKGGTHLNPAGRNKRSVWEIATAPFPSAHFATFPPKLVEPMLLAGTSEKGCCPECGKPWERVVERKPMVIARSSRTHELGRTRSSGTMLEPPEAVTTGWRPTCAHRAAPVPCQILDPFGGAGTTGLVADRLGRDCTLVELNPTYASMARERIASDAPLFVDVA